MIPQGGINPTREELNLEALGEGDVPDSQMTDTHNQTGCSRDTTAIATVFESLNRSLETFLAILSRTNERSKKLKVCSRNRGVIRTNLTFV